MLQTCHISHFNATHWSSNLGSRPTFSKYSLSLFSLLQKHIACAERRASKSWRHIPSTTERCVEERRCLNLNRNKTLPEEHGQSHANWEWSTGVIALQCRTKSIVHFFDSRMTKQKQIKHYSRFHLSGKISAVHNEWTVNRYWQGTEWRCLKSNQCCTRHSSAAVDESVLRSFAQKRVKFKTTY